MEIFSSRFIDRCLLPSLIRKGLFMSTFTFSSKFLVLASASPRRKALIEPFGIPFFCLPADLDERSFPQEEPRLFAQRMAVEKAQACCRLVEQRGGIEVLSEGRFREGLVLGGDTVVALGKRILGKPNSPEEAEAMLKDLRGRTHEVWSGWAICNQAGDVVKAGVSRGEVEFKEQSNEWIQAYVQSGEPMDKAGSYGIQGKGGQLVKRLEGSFDGIMGLPTLDVAQALIDVGGLQYSDLMWRGLEIREAVRFSAWKSGRPSDAVQVLAVSKRHSIEVLQSAYGLGWYHFGESYVQEWKEKVSFFNEHAQYSTLEWHYIGALQTNKAKRIGRWATWVHSVSRRTELEKLSEGALSRSDPLKVFLQVNVGQESTKGGLLPHEVGHVLEECKAIPQVEIVGLMGFPPYGDPESSRPYFKRLFDLRAELASPDLPLHDLSMGTSHDFRVAIEEGATWVRLGTGLFGSRN